MTTEHAAPSDVELAIVESTLGCPANGGGRLNATPQFVARLIAALREERARAAAASAALGRLRRDVANAADAYDSFGIVVSPRELRAFEEVVTSVHGQLVDPARLAEPEPKAGAVPTGADAAHSLAPRIPARA